MSASRTPTTLRTRPPSAVVVAIVRPTPEGVAYLVERLTGRTPDLAMIRAKLAALPAPARPLDS
jgi:hypothetical protein